MKKTTKRRVARIGPQVNSPMTLQEAIKQFPFPQLDQRLLNRSDQERAFQLCRAFLRDIPKTKHVNKCFTNVGLKHIVENPSRHTNGAILSECDSDWYVYEGTFLLAALSLGFKAEQGPFRAQWFPQNPPNLINISGIGLRKRCKEIAASGRPIQLEAA